MKYTITILFLMISVCGFSQFGYQNGLIITTDNDTIQCQVPITTSFGEQFSIKRNKKKAVEELVKVSDVKFLATPYTVYEQINYTKENREQQKLMKIAVEGRAYLYMEAIINNGESRDGNGGTFTAYAEPTITYVIKKDNQTIYIPQKEYSEYLIPIIYDNSEIVSKIGNKGYQYEDMEDIIREYNQKFK